MAQEVLRLRAARSGAIRLVPGGDTRSSPKVADRKEEAAEPSEEGPDPEEEAVLGEETQAQIGSLLKSSYEDLLNQPLPDQLVRLLEELERREKQK